MVIRHAWPKCMQCRVLAICLWLSGEIQMAARAHQGVPQLTCRLQISVGEYSAMHAVHLLHDVPINITLISLVCVNHSYV